MLTFPWNAMLDKLGFNSVFISLSLTNSKNHADLDLHDSGGVHGGQKLEQLLKLLLPPMALLKHFQKWLKTLLTMNHVK